MTDAERQGLGGGGVGAGVWFRRVDLPGQPIIPATVAHLVPDARHTVLHPDPARAGVDPRAAVHTTEHVLSALVGLGVTDAVIELDGPEVPIVDGSARPFVDAVLAAGLVAVEEGRKGGGEDGVRPIVIAKPVVVRGTDGVSSIAYEPPASAGAGLEVRYELDYGAGAPIRAQTAELRLVKTPCSDYIKEIAPARTFCLQAEAEAMRKAGLFGHLTPRDMLVIGADGKPIENTLRFEDEPARHKLLDVLGDLALAGRPVYGRITAHRSGHALNHALVRALLEAERNS